MLRDTFPGEPDNADRAEWARAALDTYAHRTRCDNPQLYTREPDGIEEAVQDLIGDLCHLLHQAGLDHERIIERATSTFAAELDEEQETRNEDPGDATGTDPPLQAHPPPTS